MTQSFIGSRKRGRSLGEDENRDFTPLSKRINNLHINTNVSCSDSGKQILKQDLIDPAHTNGIGHHWNGVPSNLTNGNHSGASNGQPSHGLIQLNGHSSIEQPNCQVQMMGASVRQEHLPCPNSMPLYDPDLSAGENPFYYESNKLLFDLYQERLQRSSHSQY